MKNNKISDNFVCLLIIFYINVFLFAFLLLLAQQALSRSDDGREGLITAFRSRVCSKRGVPGIVR